MISSKMSAHSGLQPFHKVLRPPPTARNPVTMEQLFFCGLCAAMLAVQAMGLLAGYFFFAHTDGRTLPRPVSPPPIMVEIFR